jgi:GT2 family glycosyltransferase
MNRANQDLSVIICAHTEERWYDLLAAIASVQGQTLPAHEIIVVVDHNPALRDRLHAHHPALHIIENHEIRGLSGARNSGIAVAQGAVLAFLDDDAVAAPDWLAQLAAAYTRPDVMGAGGLIAPLWESGCPRWFPAEFQWVVGCTYRGMPEVTSPVRNLIGCNMSFRREVFAAIGGFRSEIGRVGSRPVGCEETEICIRAQQNQPAKVLLYVPAAQVAHRVPGRRSGLAYFRARCYAEGLSKAQVAGFVGVHDGLASERNYTLRTMPVGVLRGLGDVIRHGDLAGVGRAGAIVAGLLITTTGYVVGTLARRKTDRVTAPAAG